MSRPHSHTAHDPEVTLLINLKAKKVACVLMQAAYGFGAGNHVVNRYFDSRTWDTGEGMDDYGKATLKISQWKVVAEKMNAIHARKT